MDVKASRDWTGGGSGAWCGNRTGTAKAGAKVYAGSILIWHMGRKKSPAEIGGKSHCLRRFHAAGRRPSTC